MMTNTYLPHVGGVARSVSTFVEEYRRRGHEVLVVAPRFSGRALPHQAEAVVERVAAIENFNGSNFSVRLPLAAMLSRRINAFPADIVHAHHPFLLGDTALRVAATHNAPVIFTHHTRYEDYVHYLPFPSTALRKLAISLSTEYANLCDGVIAPSESIARLIRRRGVHRPVVVVPTGIDVEAFARGQGARFRARWAIPDRAFVVGHVGRLAPEKNPGYLAEAVAHFLQRTPGARFVVAGSGPAEQDFRNYFHRQRLGDRLIVTGVLQGRGLRDAYRAMDVFAFCSLSETQGLVVLEAMAAGVPVVALHAPGVRDVVQDGRSGFLLPPQAPAQAFAESLGQLHRSPSQRFAFSGAARTIAADFSRARCAEKALAFYAEIRRQARRERGRCEQSGWRTLLKRLELEWDLLARNTRVLTGAGAS